MHVVGGVYRELCSIPHWDVTLGSGGRAALALALHTGDTVLHTYAGAASEDALGSLKRLGVTVKAALRPTDIAFAYFHPLSQPYISPDLTGTQQLQPLSVSGDVVLRFGFLEGDAVVHANRAVFDPQTWRNPPSFGANGSTAKELAIVLNEDELRSTSGLADVPSAASWLLNQQAASVVVVKRGIRGAVLVEPGRDIVHIPAYRTSRVFKIGTGDVFSAFFAYWWGQRQLDAAEAANLASRSVAAYCVSGVLPLPQQAEPNLMPLQSLSCGVVLLLGAAKTIGQRYTIEEARYVLRGLGVDVVCPTLGDQAATGIGSLLILADGLEAEVMKQTNWAKTQRIPVVVLCEGKGEISVVAEPDRVTTTDDFTSALYFAAWDAVGRSY